MSKSSTIFLRLIIFLFGLAVLSLCIFVLPAGIMSDVSESDRLFLLGMYLPAIPFFIGLYQSLKLLDSIDKNQIFSESSISSLQRIKQCGIAISILYIAGMPYIFQVAESEDAPGVAAIGLLFIFASLVVAAAAGVFQNLLQNVLDMKSENELTV